MKKLIYALTAALLVAACTNDSDNSGIVSEGLLTIPHVPDQWTYVSLTNNCIVGSCALTDTAAQHQWSERTDWDLAVCNGMLRTNGGDSGSGQGGAAAVESDYDNTDASMPAHYVTDRDTVAIW